MVFFNNIGSSKNIKKRWNRHINDLRLKKHINIHLQRSYDKYGENNFIFEVMEICKDSDILIREKFYLDTLMPYQDGFNIGKDASGGDNLTYNPNRENIIERIRKTSNDNISKMTKEERQEKWGKLGESNPNYGNKWTDDMKFNFSNFQKSNSDNPLRKRKGKSNIEMYGEERAKVISEKLSEYASKRTGDKNPFFDKKHKEESKDKIRKSRLGKKPTNRISISINDKIYESYNDASKELGIPVVTIRWRCLSNNIKFVDYKLV